MRHLLALILIVLGFGGFLTLHSFPLAAQTENRAALLVIDGTIDPVSSGFLSRGIESATEQGAGFLIVQLDTPGGLLESTREMVENILAAPIPVVVYVGPPGAQAASAGTFITAAAHVAAMAPSTNIGAALPVTSGGQDIPETLRSKVTKDTAAFLRSIAAERGRNADALEDTVLTAESYTADEALDNNIIDIIARDRDDLLAQLDGRTVEAAGGQVTLEIDGIDVFVINRTPVERFIGFLANPNVAFLLLALGGLGILIEFLSPGLLGPGILGVICLALAFLAMGSLPTNWVGVGLVILAMALFYMEAQAPGVGIFGISGAVSFVLGAFLIFGNLSFRPSPPPLPGAPSFELSLWIIGIVSALMFGSMVLTLRAIRQAKMSPVYSFAASKVVGQVGKVASELNPRGTVQVAGELWSAESDSGEPIAEGEEVIVLEAEGLTLKVFSANRELVEGLE
jgi:membrane-bound serine protease (ClpP class)